MLKSPPTYHEMCGLSPCADFLTIPPFFEQKLKEHPRKTRVGLTYWGTWTGYLKTQTYFIHFKSLQSEQLRLLGLEWISKDTEKIHALQILKNMQSHSVVESPRSQAAG